MGERKAFNFYRSYYETGKLLSDKDRLQFYDAIFERQFNGIEPKDLKGSALLAWTGQRYSIDAQVKGYEDKTGVKLQHIENHTTKHPAKGGIDGGCQEEKEKEEGEEKVKEKEQLVFPFQSEEFLNTWKILLSQKKWRNKSITSLQASLKKLSEYPEPVSIKMMENTIAGEWQGLFELKQGFNNGTTNQQSKHDNIRNALAEAERLDREQDLSDTYTD